ncbi:Uncharacterised protein [Streptococcus pneumoniae]|nr:Uncharacterised protein [Streptococcus pneumoniae]
MTSHIRKLLSMYEEDEIESLEDLAAMIFDEISAYLPEEA